MPEVLHVIDHAREELFPLSGIGGPHRFKVRAPQVDIRVRPDIVAMEMKEGLRTKVKVRWIDPHVDQTIDRAQRVDQLLVRHAALVWCAARRRQGRASVHTHELCAGRAPPTTMFRVGPDYVTCQPRETVALDRKVDRLMNFSAFGRHR
jgi:hypothetical protein